MGAEFPSKGVCSTRVSSQLDQKIPVNNLKYIEQGCDLTKESVTPLSSFVFSLFCQASLQKFIIMFPFSDKTQQKKYIIKCDKSMKTINSFTTVGGVGGSENYQICRAHSLTLTMKLYLSIETENLWSHKKRTGVTGSSVVSWEGKGYTGK